MPEAGARAGRHEGWVSGVAALLVHGAVVLALPGAPSSVPNPTPELWLSVLAAPSPAIEAPVVADEAPLPTATPARVRPHRLSHARVAAARAPAADTSAPAPALASSSGDVGPGGPAGVGPASTSPDTGHRVGSGPGRGPGLLPVRNPCGGYFPASAKADHGQVRVHVQVDEAGHVSVARVLLELPNGQDFGDAARACAAALRFVPAIDAHGMAVVGDAKLELSFHRS